jgi:hypothetical protein
MNQTQPNATSPPINCDRDEVKGDQISSIGDGLTEGAGMGRDMALYGADVLNIWRPHDSEVEAFAWDVQVGTRLTILDDS